MSDYDILEIYFENDFPKHVVLRNKEVVPVSNAYDSDGDELFENDDLSDLNWIVAGPTADGKWLTEYLKEGEWQRYYPN